MILFLIFLIGFIVGDITWAFKIAGIYILAIIAVEALFWLMWFGFFGLIFAILI